MIFAGWISLILLGVAGSLGAFLWAWHSGQFADQGRACYLPLSDDSSLSRLERSSRRPAEVYALACVLGMGFLAFGTAVAMTLMRLSGWEGP